MVYVWFIVLKSCFIDPFIWSLYYKRFWYSGRVCYQSDNNNDILLRPSTYFALSISCLFTAVLFSTILLENIFSVIPGNGFPLLVNSSSLGTPSQGVKSLGLLLFMSFLLPRLQFLFIFCQENSFYLCCFILKVYFKSPLFSTEIFSCGLAYNPCGHC